MPKLSTEQFISKAQSIHGERYDYSKSNYVGNNFKLIIICKQHGEFLQLSSNHICGRGCPLCYKDKIIADRVDAIANFIRSANLVHNNKYNYDKVLSSYTNATNKVIIICPEHGEFLQTPGSHVQNHGCPACGLIIVKNVSINNRHIAGLGAIKKLRKKQSVFIEQANIKHNDVYCYSKVNYINTYTKVIVVCHLHGEFTVSPVKHLSGKICPTCSHIAGNHKLTKSTSQFIYDSKVVHGDRYDYSKAFYTNRNDFVTIICKEHGEFQQKPYIHTGGSGCGLCYESHGEREIGRFLTTHHIKFVRQAMFKSCRDKLPLRFDFATAPDSKLVLIEYQGGQHFRPVI